MIHSMTAFARHEAQGEWGSLVWEIRSINHRYLEINLRLPEKISALEPVLREQIKQRLQRGKIEITLRYQLPKNIIEKICVNQTLVTQLINACAAITVQARLSPTALDPLAILQWPGILQMPDEAVDDLRQAVKDTFTQTLTELLALRAREGSALQTLIEQRLDAMEIEIGKVIAQLPRILQEHREKLVQRLADIKANVDPHRLEQELVFFAQKIDVAEEMDRLVTHLAEMRNTLKQGEAVGRRLDFLLQELNREANTLASKSVTTATTMAAVELKVLIEQIREQVQNIE
jgi:uncharacterized protein (TIGR00255 family)